MRLYENMKTINAYQLHVELEKINTTVVCTSDTAIASHHIRMSAWIYWIKEKIFWGMQCIALHTTCFSIRWAMVLCHCPLNVTLQLARAAAVLELIGQFFLQLHLLKFYVVLAYCSGLVSCRLCQIKHDVWINCSVNVDKTEVIWLVLLTCFRFYNGRNL